jgi:hypothetical protein
MPPVLETWRASWGLLQLIVSLTLVLIAYLEAEFPFCESATRIEMSAIEIVSSFVQGAPPGEVSNLHV